MFPYQEFILLLLLSLLHDDADFGSYRERRCSVFQKFPMIFMEIKLMT
jgi:hypothetical protein